MLVVVSVVDDDLQKAPMNMRILYEGLVTTVESSLSNQHVWAIIVAGIFVLAALALSTFLLVEHLTAYNNPEEQKWLIGVIFMVPIYSVESFISLWKPDVSLECNILRNCYEAYALYSFGCYLIACLGGEDKVIEKLERQATGVGPRTPLLEHSASGQSAFIKHVPPLNLCLQPWVLGEDFYQAAKFGIVQYMILKTFCAFLALILEQFNLYGDAEFNWETGYPYITIVLNFSQTWALYCLIQFYAVTRDELAPIRPLAKFVCFKSIVFATWWQEVIFAFIFSEGFAPKWLPEGIIAMLGDNFQRNLQDFIICLEMSVAAVAHIYIFPATPYQMMDGLHRRGSVAVLADYASIDSPLDPEEIKESERPSIVRLLAKDIEKTATSLKESFHDVVFGGGEHVVNDVKITMSQAVEPMEKGINRINETLHQLHWVSRRKEKDKDKHVKDDAWLSDSSHKSVRGIDDPLLTGSVSDSGLARGRKPNPSYGSADSSGESSDQGGGFKTGGRRWTVRR